MTRRDLQGEMKKQGRPWCIGKAFDHSAPIGPITPAADAGDVNNAADLAAGQRQRAPAQQRQQADLEHRRNHRTPLGRLGTATRRPDLHRHTRRRGRRGARRHCWSAAWTVSRPSACPSAEGNTGFHVAHPVALAGLTSARSATPAPILDSLFSSTSGDLFMIQRRTLLQSGAAVALGAPRPGGLCPTKRHAQVPHLHVAAVQRVAQHAQGLDGQGREGLRWPHQVRRLPRHAARRLAGAAVRPGQGRRGRHRLDPARQHAGPLPAHRSLRAAVHDEQRRSHLARPTGNTCRRWPRTSSRMCSPLALQVHGPGVIHMRRQADQDRRRPARLQGARPHPPDHQDAGLPGRHAGRHAAAADPRLAVQRRDRRLRDPLGSGALGQGAGADQVPQRVRPGRRRALHHHLRDGHEQGEVRLACHPTSRP